MQSTSFKPGVAIIGDGKVGCALFRYISALQAETAALITNDSNRIPSLKEELKTTHVFGDVTALPPSATVVLICVQDEFIQRVAETLLKASVALKGKLVAHTSGIRTSDELAALADTGAHVGSLHPIQSFHSRDIAPGVLKNIGCGIEGSEGFVVRAEEFAAMLGWRSIVVSKRKKPLYHAACVLAGNFTVALAMDVLALLEASSNSDAGFEHFLPMMREVLNRLYTIPPADAITGPAVRGDADAIASHLSQIGNHNKDIEVIYATWTKRILDIADIDEGTRQKVMAAIRDQID